MHVRRKTYVDRVDAGSQAEAAGVKPGWKTLQVNGENPKGKIDAQRSIPEICHPTGPAVCENMYLNLPVYCDIYNSVTILGTIFLGQFGGLNVFLIDWEWPSTTRHDDFMCY